MIKASDMRGVFLDVFLCLGVCCSCGPMYDTLSLANYNAKLGVGISKQTKSEPKPDSGNKFWEQGKGPDFDLLPIKIGVGLEISEAVKIAQGNDSGSQGSNSNKPASGSAKNTPLVPFDPLILYKKRTPGVGLLSYLMPKNSSVPAVPNYTQNKIGMNQGNILDEPISNIFKEE